VDLPVTVAVLLECTTEEFKVWNTLLVADASSSLYQGG